MSDEGIPATWTRICGLSLDRSTVGAVWLAHDRKAKVMSVYDEYSVPTPALPILADVLNARCGKNEDGKAWIPVIMDGQMFGRTREAGAAMMMKLADLGVPLADARSDEEAGFALLDQSLLAGRLTVEPTCRRWQAEWDTFFRDDLTGKLPPEGFHLLRATALALMLEPAEWANEARASSDRQGYEPSDATRNPVTGY